MNFLKFGFAYALAPALVMAVAWLLGVTIGLTLTAVTLGLAIMAAAVLAIALGRALIPSLQRWLRNTFSPVRRRHPRPAAWRQWR